MLNIAPASRPLRTYPTITVSAAESKLGCTNSIFVEPGAKINKQYYRGALLMQELLPVAICSIAGDAFVFKQDDAPVHHAYGRVELLYRDTPTYSV